MFLEIVLELPESHTYLASNVFQTWKWTCYEMQFGVVGKLFSKLQNDINYCYVQAWAHMHAETNSVR